MFVFYHKRHKDLYDATFGLLLDDIPCAVCKIGE